MREVAPRSPLAQLRGRGGPTLFDLRQVLEGAARDPRLSAVIVRIAGLETGLATADELHALLRALGRAGKRTIALLEGDSAGVREYLVASGAGEVVANPNTLLTMLGVAAGGVLLRGALDKLSSRRRRCNGRSTRARQRRLRASGCRPSCKRASRQSSPTARRCWPRESPRLAASRPNAPPSLRAAAS